MIVLIAGLALFVGLHSSRLVAPNWREQQIAKHGLKRFKLWYSVVSLIGFVLLIYGYGLSRRDPVFLYQPQLWTYHLAIPLTWIALVLVGASHGPPNYFRSRLGHPMYAGVKVWAFAHLLANGRLGDVVLFGTLLVWAIAGFTIRRKQDRAAGLVPEPSTTRGTIGALIGGTVFWAVFAFWLHPLLIGVDPIPF